MPRGGILLITKERNKNSNSPLPLNSYTELYNSKLYGDAGLKLEGENLIIDLLHAPLFIGDL